MKKSKDKTEFTPRKNSLANQLVNEVPHKRSLSFRRKSDPLNVASGYISANYGIRLLKEMKSVLPVSNSPVFDRAIAFIEKTKDSKQNKGCLVYLYFFKPKAPADMTIDAIQVCWAYLRQRSSECFYLDEETAI